MTVLSAPIGRGVGVGVNVFVGVGVLEGVCDGVGVLVAGAKLKDPASAREKRRK